MFSAYVYNPRDSLTGINMKNRNTRLLSSFCLWGTLPSQIAGVLLALFIIAPVIRGQTNTGQIQGLVKDQAGAVVPGVTVTATHVASNSKVERLTNESGEFLFPSLAVGEYTLSASVTGFKQITKTGI